MWKFDSQGNLVSLVREATKHPGIWVPSEQVAFHRADFPPGRQRMWEQTAPFILEEQLIEPVEDQHFVIGRSDTDHGKVPVAVVSRALMESWVTSWERENIAPETVCPDVLAVPLENDRAALWHEGGRCLLRLDAQTGFAGSPEWIRSLFEAGGRSDNLDVYSDAAGQLPDALQKLARALPCSLDDRMRMGFDSDALAMNFLQGAFRRTSALASLVQVWKWAGVAAAALFFAYTASVAMQTKLLHETTASLRQATIELYQQHFQDRMPATGLRTQVSRRMDQVRSGVVNRDTSLWKALSYVEPALSSCKACRVEEISLEGSSLYLLVSSSQGVDNLLRRIGNIEQIKVDSEFLDDTKERKQLRLRLEVDVQA